MPDKKKKEIVHWTIRITWSDGEKEWLDDIPYIKGVENYLDKLETKANEEWKE